MKYKKIKLEIIYTNNPKKLLPNSVGTYDGTKNIKRIFILKTKDVRDSLIHELCHFILDITNRGGFTHTKKHRNLHNFLKDLLR